MKWQGKVDQHTKDKIQLLYREFDKFIEENHAANTPEDHLLLKQWNNFKMVIEKNPTDFENMHSQINRLTEDDGKDNKGVRGSSPMPMAKGKEDNRIDVNKSRLKKMSNDLILAIGRNSKDLFKV